MFVEHTGGVLCFIRSGAHEEQATMRAHGEFLQSQLAAGTLVVASPVRPAGS